MVRSFSEKADRTKVLLLVCRDCGS